MGPLGHTEGEHVAFLQLLSGLSLVFFVVADPDGRQAQNGDLQAVLIEAIEAKQLAGRAQTVVVPAGVLVAVGRRRQQRGEELGFLKHLVVVVGHVAAIGGNFDVAVALVLEEISHIGEQLTVFFIRQDQGFFQFLRV